MMMVDVNPFPGPKWHLVAVAALGPVLFLTGSVALIFLVPAVLAGNLGAAAAGAAVTAVPAAAALWALTGCWKVLKRIDFGASYGVIDQVRDSEDEDR